MPNARYNRLIVRLVSIVVAVAVAVATTAFSLKLRDRRIEGLPTSLIPIGSGSVEDYIWLSEHDLAYEARTDKGSLKTVLFNSSDHTRRSPDLIASKSINGRLLAQGITTVYRWETLSHQSVSPSGISELPFGRIVITLPEMMRAVEFDRQLKGGRIVWLLEHKPGRVWSALAQHMAPAIIAPFAEPSMEIWVSGPRGEQFKRIGRVGLPPHQSIIGLRWVRGGRAASFVVSNNLYTVSINR